MSSDAAEGWSAADQDKLEREDLIEQLPTERQLEMIVLLGRRVGLRMSPTHVRSYEQAERIIRNLELLNSRMR